MISNPISEKIKQVIPQGMTWLETRFKHWTKPVTSKQAMGTLADLKRSQRELLAGNMCLRQPLMVLERQVSRPQMIPRDRQLLVVLASRIKGWCC